LVEGSLLVIDEVQRVPDCSKVIKGLWDRSLHNKKNLRVVRLGSSSLSIQRGMSESIAERFELTIVPHWGFHECQREFNHTLDEWLIWGGYPGADTYRGQDARWRSYFTNSIVDAVIAHDILTQKVVRNPAGFRLF
jgi:predicted AAA+ superfamily ATPase